MTASSSSKPVGAMGAVQPPNVCQLTYSTAPTSRGRGSVGELLPAERSGFASHSSKSYLSKLQRGAFYVKESESHGYCDLSLSAEGASLAPEGLLAGLNNVPGW